MGGHTTGPERPGNSASADPSPRDGHKADPPGPPNSNSFNSQSPGNHSPREPNLDHPDHLDHLDHPDPVALTNELPKLERIPTGTLPKSQRRGLLSSVVIPRERYDARSHSGRMKSVIVAIIAIAAMIAPMGSSIFLPSMQDVAKDLHTSTNIVNVSFGIYMLALGIFPLWWASISETSGRRSVYIVSFTMFFGFTIGCALAPSIGALMVFRVLSGGAAAAVQAVGAGTISDVYITTERGRAMGYYYLGPLCGPLLAPILGGLITTKWGWRGTQWFLVIVGGAILVVIVFFLPETLRSQALITEGRALLAQKEAESEKNDIPLNQAKDPQDPQLPQQQQLHSEHEPDSEHKHELHESDQDSYRHEVHSVHHAHDGHDEDDQIADVLAPSISHRSARSIRSGRSPNDLEGGPLQLNVTTASERMMKRAEAQQDQTSTSVVAQVYHVLIRPFRTMKFLKFPPVTLAIICSSYCFFCLYFLNIGVESLYTASPYHFRSIIVGLMYIPNSVGYVLSSIINGYWSDLILKRSIARSGKEVPEVRIAENVYFASALYPASLLLFGWTAHAKTFWLVPMIGTFLFGISSMIIFGNTMTYLVDTIPGRGSAGVALNNLLRMCLAAVATFVAGPLENAMGFGWLYTMLAIGAILAFLPVVAIKRWGPHWRETIDIEKIY